MDRIWKYLSTNRGLYTLSVAGAVVYLLYQLRNGLPQTTAARLYLPAIPLGLIFIYAMVTRKSWEKWAGIAVMASLLLAVVWMLFTAEFRWTNLIGAGLIALGIYQLANGLLAEDDAQESEEEGAAPLISLVLLLRELPHLEPFMIARFASQAWGIEVSHYDGSDEDESSDTSEDDQEQSEDDEGQAFIVGAPPLMMLKHPTGMFVMHMFDSTYWEEDKLPDVQASIPELRAQHAIGQHRAWISVDLLGSALDMTPDCLKEAYRMIGRLLAEIADDNTLAVLDPEKGWLRPYDPEIEAKLRSDDPQEAFRELYYSPVITVPSDDPAMIQAVEECRARFPEFVTAFEARDTADKEVPFMIKAPFTENDNTEFMWVEVTAIENDKIYGTLANEPANLPRWKEGDRVTVPVAELNDFLFMQNNEPVGGFTLKVIADRTKQKPES